MAQRLAHSHQVTVRATVSSPEYGILSDLPVSGGDVVADAGSQVRRTARVELADPSLWPDHPRAVLSPLGSEMLVEYGVHVGGGDIEWVPLITGVLSSGHRRRPQTSGPVRIELVDRSDLVAQDRFESPTQTLSGVTAVSEITRLIRQTLPQAEVIDLSGSTVTVPRIEIERERWADGIEAVAKSASLDVCADQLGRFTIRRVPQVSDPAAWTITEGEGGTLVEAEEELTRDRVYNRVIATGERTDGSTPVVGTATDTDPASPTRYNGPLGRKPRFYSSPLLASTAQAQAAAASILETARGVAAQVTLRAITNPGLEPGDVVRLAGGRTPQVHILDRVVTPLGVGLQQLATRSLDLPMEGS
ncbi:DUF5047 domain-containing protein [Actinoalloteichus sp. GBA129-24]|uniref:DUF5047 domain-containing protein n=1 Tax=Actinoalloteichus sp. GBA129-24 TaxID=1612551 RepID=UPI0012FCE96F|nr:DUF5047 domain-containing protein [Actinoalloteichus sp. GBA129-24]